MRYKVGDRVRIKSLDWYNENKNEEGRVACGYHIFTKDMSKFCGCTMIVCNRTNLGVMTMGGSASYWTDEMIEGLVEEETLIKLTGKPIKNDEMVVSINEYTLPDGYIFKDENGNVINATKIVLEKKKKEYPKTYEECIMLALQGAGYNRACLLVKFEKLLTCRDAYWKIAGEEMGLGKPWKPDWGDDGIKYTIEYYDEEIIKDLSLLENRILVFPDAKMRDAFYENFKELIEECKELL